MMQTPDLGNVLVKMAGKAKERAEYLGRYSDTRDASSVMWALYAVLLEGAQECLRISKEIQERSATNEDTLDRS